MGRIVLLSEALVNKIAAGEVVERPASVVKELCENAVDAGARTVRVLVEDGGLGRIEVRDDGHGMAPDDAVLCLERHATSKLKDVEGLFSIDTMGFRGEALPSIASVSRFSLATAEHGAEHGVRISMEGGTSTTVEDTAPLGGTVVEVRDLFFNVPARRKYMKQTSTELRHIEDAVVRLALAHPEVAFFLAHGDRQLFASPSNLGDPADRIAAVLGAAVRPHLLAIFERRLGLCVTGQVASPEYTLPNARGLFTFVNRRYVRDRGLNFAIGRAYAPLLPPGRQPVGVIFIELDPHAVDVNVHPQKMEVRFLDGRGVQDAVLGAVGRAVKAAPWLGSPAQSPFAQGPEAAHYALAVERFLDRARAQGEGEPRSAPFLLAEDAARKPAFGEARPDRNSGPSPGWFSTLHYLGELGRRFWVCEGYGGTLLVLDSHAALERVLLSRFTERLVHRLAGSAPEPASLFSRQVALTALAAQTVLERRQSFQLLGVELSPFGGSAVAVAGLPPELADAELTELLPQLSENLPPQDSVDSVEGLAPCLAVMACHAACLQTRLHSHDEVRALLVQLDGSTVHEGVLHGALVVLELPFLELVRRAEGKN